MRPRWALLTGMVRDEAAFLDKLALLRDWGEAGHLDGVCVSTWIGELDRYPGVAAELGRMGAAIVESREMDLKLPGSFLHQVATVRNGLSAVPSDALVFRLRSDKCVLSAGDHRAFDRVEAPVLPLPGGTRAFSRRVVVRGGQFLTPFFLMDQMVCAAREDLARLFRHDLTLEVEGSEVIPEQALFAPPFVAAVPVLDLFFRVHRLICGRPLDRWIAAVQGGFRSSLYLEAMAAWLLALHGHFRVGFQDEPGHDWPAVSLGSLLAPGASSFLGFDSQMNALSFGSDAWIAAVLEGRTASDPATSRLLRARDRLEEGTGIAWSSPSSPPPDEALELDDFYRGLLGGEGKLPRASGSGLRFDGPRGRWALSGRAVP